MKNLLKGFNSEFEQGEESTWRYASWDYSLRRRKKRNEQSLRDLWDTLKHANTHLTGNSGEKSAQRIFEKIMAIIFPVLMKNIYLHNQKSQLQKINLGIHSKTNYNKIVKRILNEEK